MGIPTPSRPNYLSSLDSVSRFGNALVVRVDFSDPDSWEAVITRICAPVLYADHTAYANVVFVEDPRCRDASIGHVLDLIPKQYDRTVAFVVDELTSHNPEHPIVVLDLQEERGRTFRAIPSQIQTIECNLLIGNMDFLEFANSTGEDGIFRGF